MTHAEKLKFLKAAVKKQEDDSPQKAKARLMKAGILTKKGNISPFYREKRAASAS